MDYDENIKDMTDDELVLSAGRIHQKNSAPVEVTLRLKKSIDELNYSTEKYNQGLLSFIVLLFFIGFMQLFISLQSATSISSVNKVFTPALIMGFLMFIVRFLEKNKK